MPNGAEPGAGLSGGIVLGDINPTANRSDAATFPVLSQTANFKLDYTVVMNAAWRNHSTWDIVRSANQKLSEPTISSIEILPVDRIGQPLRAQFETRNGEIQYDANGKAKVVGYLPNGPSGTGTVAGYKTFYRIGDKQGNATYLVPTNKLSIAPNNIPGSNKAVEEIQRYLAELDKYAQTMTSNYTGKSVYELQDLYTTKKLQ